MSLFWILGVNNVTVCYDETPQRVTVHLTRTPSTHELRWDDLQLKSGYNPTVCFIVSTGLENSLGWGPTFSSFLYNPQGLKRYQHIVVTLSIITEWFEWIKIRCVIPFLIFSAKLILALHFNCWNQLTVARPPHIPETHHLHKPLSSVLPPYVQVEF